MTNDDREWFEKHVTDALDRIETNVESVDGKVGNLRERVRAVEVRSGFVAAIVSAVIAGFVAFAKGEVR